MTQRSTERGGSDLPRRHKHFPHSACQSHLVLYGGRICPNARTNGLKVCKDCAKEIGAHIGWVPRRAKPRDLTLADKAALSWVQMKTNGELQAEVNKLQRTIDELTALPPAKRRQHPAAAPPVQGMVYALLSGYNIKIGWTGRDLTERLREYPPSTRVLVHFPGKRGDETRIKRKFAHLRTHGTEWFPYAPQVTEWVELMIAEHGDPDPSLTCGPAKYQVPRPYAQKEQPRPRGWVQHIS